MIIEIKGLPEGQKIKHINVDVTFDDIGSTDVKTSIDKLHIPENLKLTPGGDVIYGDEVDIGMVPPHPVDKHGADVREQKPIPDEMKDLEF